MKREAAFLSPSLHGPNQCFHVIEVAVQCLAAGTYDVDVKLFADGAMIARTTSALEVIKAGFEQYVAEAAVNHGLLYGLVTMLMAMMTGWIASVMFRRD